MAELCASSFDMLMGKLKVDLAYFKDNLRNEEHFTPLLPTVGQVPQPEIGLGTSTPSFAEDASKGAPGSTTPIGDPLPALLQMNWPLQVHQLLQAWQPPQAHQPQWKPLQQEQILLLHQNLWVEPFQENQDLVVQPPQALYLNPLQETDWQDNPPPWAQLPWVPLQGTLHSLMVQPLQDLYLHP